MANLTNFGTFYPRRLSEYVPAMQYSADVQLGSSTRISFGAPITTAPNTVLNAQSIATAGAFSAATMTNSGLMDTPFGRTLYITTSAAGAGSAIIDGFDYLNQPMSETIAYNAAGGTSFGKKAFKYLRQVTTTAVAGATISVGSSNLYGLPYKAIKVYTEEANGIPATVGTLVAPDLTVPATLTTSDTRGTYSPTTTQNGINVITATFDFANDVDANNNGGLMGVPHYSN